MTIRWVFDALWPVVLLWCGLIAFAIWRDATWPHSTQREVSFVALAVVATFLVLLSTILVRRMHHSDYLTISLAVAFGSCSLMPFYLMAAGLWPVFFMEHRFRLTIATAAALIVGSGVAIVALALTPDQGSYAAKQRAEGVVEGHAAGVAQEQHDQHDREMAAGD